MKPKRTIRSFVMNRNERIVLLGFMSRQKHKKNGKERFVLKKNGKERCVQNVKERSAQPCLDPLRGPVQPVTWGVLHVRMLTVFRNACTVRKFCNWHVSVVATCSTILEQCVTCPHAGCMYSMYTTHGPHCRV